jgi:hypothetical protein
MACSSTDICSSSFLTALLPPFLFPSLHAFLLHFRRRRASNPPSAPATIPSHLHRARPGGTPSLPPALSFPAVPRTRFLCSSPFPFLRSSLSSSLCLFVPIACPGGVRASLSRIHEPVLPPPLPPPLPPSLPLFQEEEALAHAEGLRLYWDRPYGSHWLQVQCKEVGREGGRKGGREGGRGYSCGP